MDLARLLHDLGNELYGARCAPEDTDDLALGYLEALRGVV